jgi:hypothetical protein
MPFQKAFSTDVCFYVKGPLTGGIWTMGPYPTPEVIERIYYYSGLGQTQLFYTYPMGSKNERLVYANQQGIEWGTPTFTDCNQLIPFINVDSLIIRLPSHANDTGHLQISSNISWRISSTSNDWLSVSKVNGNGNDSVTLTTSSYNPSPVPRVALLTMLDCHQKTFQGVQVVQNGTPYGVEELRKNSLCISPNPMEQDATITVTGPSPDEQISYSIYDLFGRYVKGGNFSGGLFVLRRNGLSSGVYMLDIRDKSGRHLAASKLLLN